jgi:hypothetical protein
VITYPVNSYCSQARSLTQYYCMLLDGGRITRTCCGNNIRGEEELLRWRAINCWFSRRTRWVLSGIVTVPCDLHWKYRVFQEELYNGIPNGTVWRVKDMNSFSLSVNVLMCYVRSLLIYSTASHCSMRPVLFVLKQCQPFLQARGLRYPSLQ